MNASKIPFSQKGRKNSKKKRTLSSSLMILQSELMQDKGFMVVEQLFIDLTGRVISAAVGFLQRLMSNTRAEDQQSFSHGSCKPRNEKLPSNLTEHSSSQSAKTNLFPPMNQYVSVVIKQCFHKRNMNQTNTPKSKRSPPESSRTLNQPENPQSHGA